MPGPFHIELAFFKVYGKIVEDSVGPEMLTDSGVLPPVSLNGFLQGKYFNTCRGNTSFPGIYASNLMIFLTVNLLKW